MWQLLVLGLIVTQLIIIYYAVRDAQYINLGYGLLSTYEDNIIVSPEINHAEQTGSQI